MKGIKEFSTIFWTMVDQYNNTSDPLVRDIIDQSLVQTTKRWTNQPPSMISVRAKELAELHKLNLWDMQWKHRNKAGKDSKGRSLLLWEHVQPNTDWVRNHLLKCKSYAEVLNLMNKYPGVCWIHREEDDLLTSNGYQRKRPTGWQSCYSDVGIQIIYSNK